jgi:transposase
VPPTVAIGNVHEDALLPKTVAQIAALHLPLVEGVFDCGFTTKATLVTMASLGAKVFIVGSLQNGARLPIASGARAGSPTSTEIHRSIGVLR